MATPNTSASTMAIDSDNNPDWPLVLDVILLMFVTLEPDRKRPDLGRVAEHMGPFFTMEKIRHRLGGLKKLTVFQSRIQAAQAAVKKFQPSHIPTQEDMDRELAGWVDTPHEPPRPFTEISAPSGPRLLDHYPPDPEVWRPNVNSMRQGPPQPDHRSSRAGQSNSMSYRAVRQNWPPAYHGPSRGTPVSRGPDHQRSNPNKIPLGGKGSGIPTLPSRRQQNEQSSIGPPKPSSVNWEEPGIPSAQVNASSVENGGGARRGLQSQNQTSSTANQRTTPAHSVSASQSQIKSSDNKQRPGSHATPRQGNVPKSDTAAKIVAESNKRQGNTAPNIPGAVPQSKHAVQASGETSYQEITSSQDPAEESSDDDSEATSPSESSESNEVSMARPFSSQPSLGQRKQDSKIKAETQPEKGTVKKQNLPPGIVAHGKKRKASASASSEKQGQWYRMGKGKRGKKHRSKNQSEHK